MLKTLQQPGNMTENILLNLVAGKVLRLIYQCRKQGPCVLFRVHCIRIFIFNIHILHMTLYLTIVCVAEEGIILQ